MSDTVIRVENLSKQYRLGTVGTGTLAHDLNRMWAKIRGLEDPYLKVGDTNRRSSISKSDYVWALKNVNFEIARGEVLGVVGKNGAGKSTLLKILSQVTSPSTGSVKIKGRIGSLLEVGTGFHPELTARENIFLNGSILGMKKKEISKRFEEIVDFAGIAKYVDTPVKRFSSGMTVRLGFSVAAHLEPEILIIDEVLAVGDLEFQNKCMGKMQDVSSKGRTILFVSHNLNAIRRLTSKCILIEEGCLTYSGTTKDVLNHYTNEVNHTVNRVNLHSREGLGNVLLKDLILNDGDRIKTGEPLGIRVVLESSFKDDYKVRVAIAIDTLENERIFVIDSSMLGSYLHIKNKSECIFELPKLMLTPGKYKMTFFCSSNDIVEDWIKDVCLFEVDSGDYYHNSKVFYDQRSLVFADFEVKVD